MQKRACQLSVSTALYVFQSLPCFRDIRAHLICLRFQYSDYREGVKDLRGNKKFLTHIVLRVGLKSAPLHPASLHRRCTTWNPGCAGGRSHAHSPSILHMNLLSCCGFVIDQDTCSCHATLSLTLTNLPSMSARMCTCVDSREAVASLFCSASREPQC